MLVIFYHYLIMKGAAFLLVLIIFVVLRNGYATFNFLQQGVKIVYSVTLMSTCRSGKDHFRRILGVKLPECVKQCGLRPHCEALSFERKMNFCDLFTTADGENLSNGSCIYVVAPDIKVEKTPCGVCTYGQVCDTDSKDCKVEECLSEVINNGAVLGNMKVEGSMIRYKCNNGYWSGTKTAICQRNGTYNVASKCQKAAVDCLDLKQCDSSYTDGEYWLFPDVLKGQKVKVFCSGMLTSSPSEYISVDKDINYGFNGGEDNSDGTMTRYMKIRVNLTTLEIDRMDTTFTDPVSSSLPFARGRSCNCLGTGTCLPWRGNFSISSVGTGLKFSDQVNWVPTGYVPGMSDFVRSEDGTAISARCGGHCGYCDPDGPLYMYYNEHDNVEDGSATTPVCT